MRLTLFSALVLFYVVKSENKIILKKTGKCFFINEESGNYEVYSTLSLQKNPK